MVDANEAGARMRSLTDERLALETRLRNERGDLSEAQLQSYDRQYFALERSLTAFFSEAPDDQTRIAVMLELMRILENRLVYLQNFLVDPTADSRVLARLVTQFIDRMAGGKGGVLTSLEATYYRAVAALYAGAIPQARDGFTAACESGESDEANDIKYKSYVILGHLAHEERDYAKAKELHEQSLRYTRNTNVTAQALALKALNAYALHEFDEALHLFEESLRLFDANEPFFNSYFHRNALLFCGAIHYDRKEYGRAVDLYRRVAESVDHRSYDYFDALSHLGRIQYAEGRYAEAASTLEGALRSQHFAENESIVDTWFWIARSLLEQDDTAGAKEYLRKIADTDVHYAHKPQAMELLQRIA